MNSTIASERGKCGEELAQKFLRNHGFRIRALNWRNGRYEIDIIAQRFDRLHFVEVKTRSKGGWSAPADAITPAKFAALLKAARLYMATYRIDLEPQFDLVAVEIDSDGGVEITHTERAMECNW